MREAAETHDDVAVATGPVDTARQRGLVARQCSEQRNGAVLVVDVFGMLERQIGELAFDRRQQQVVAAVDQPDCQTAGLLVAGIGTGAVAERVARQLVKYQQMGERAAWRIVPVVQFPVQGAVENVPVACADQGIECRIPGEPGDAGQAVVGVVRSAEPEVENAVGGAWSRHGRNLIYLKVDCPG